MGSVTDAVVETVRKLELGLPRILLRCAIRPIPSMPVAGAALQSYSYPFLSTLDILKKFFGSIGLMFVLNAKFS